MTSPVPPVGRRALWRVSVVVYQKRGSTTRVKAANILIVDLVIISISWFSHREIVPIHIIWRLSRLLKIVHASSLFTFGWYCFSWCEDRLVIPAFLVALAVHSSRAFFPTNELRRRAAVFHLLFFGSLAVRLLGAV